MHSANPVNRFMTSPVLTVDINDPAGEVLRLFAGCPLHHLPVLDQDKVVGTQFRRRYEARPVPAERQQISD